MAFRGTYDYSLDAKNRLTVPARFRAALSDGLVVAKGVERCVELWTPDEYERRMRGALEGINPLDPRARKVKTFFAANAFPGDLDSAGRVMVPPKLMEHARLGKEVTVAGAEECLQIWDRAAWSAYNDALADDILDITASFGQPA